MNILAIDTSNQVLGIAIVSDGKVVGEVVTNVKKGHSQRLMPAINYLMKEVDFQPEQLDQIAVAKGPGSYTGVRIGVATAKSLAWALDIPIVGISSIEVLAYQGRFFTSLISPFFDARRQTVFTGLFEWNNHTLEKVNKEANILMEDWLNSLAQMKKEVLFLSPHLGIYKDMIVDNLGDLAIFPAEPYHFVRPSHLALASIDKQPDHLHTLSPNYLRLAEAEINWLKRKKENK